MLTELEGRTNKSLYRVDLLLKFMAALTGKNKSGGKNGIARLQYFLNAYIQEQALKNLNREGLSFAIDDHDGLELAGHGNPEPDFIFKSASGKTFTIDAKIYKNATSCKAISADTNFHNADYALAFLKDANE